jgi:serine/threonine protein kinase
MKNGGIDLFKYGKKISTILNNNMNSSFWIEFHRIIKGIELFLKNGYLHYDIKPDNIIYDEKNNRINFIDFGLMRKKRDIFDKGIDNKHYVLYHPTYSLEHFFYNKINYDKILLGSPDDKKRFLLNFKNLIENQTSDNKLQTVHNSMVILFKWIKNADLKMRILKDYEEFIMLERKENGFLNFIILAVNKFDIYGLGLTIIYLLNNMEHLLSSNKDFFDDMFELAYNMINPNIYNRFNILKVEDTYRKIMIKYFIKNKNIKEILKTHELPEDKIGGKNKTGKNKNIKEYNLKSKKNKILKKISNTFTVKKNGPIKIFNIDIHTKISKKKTKVYRFLKNKKRNNNLSINT